MPWNSLFDWAKSALREDAQEWLASLLLEPYGPLVDDLAEGMSYRSGIQIDGTMSVAALRTLLEDSFGWTLDIDFTSKKACAWLWYVSEEKLEPRVGERFEEPIAAFEEPLSPGRDAAALFDLLLGLRANALVADVLLKHPEFRSGVRRVQANAIAPYSEIRDNTISADLLPIEMLRCKLSFFGATRFDSRSDRWVRICIFGSAPYPEELASDPDDDWPHPAEA